MNPLLLAANPSDTSVTTWFTGTVPYDTALLGKSGRTTSGFPVYFGRAIGTHSIVTHMKATIPAFGRVAESFNVTSNPLPEFKLSPWVSDDPLACIPRAVVRVMREGKLLTLVAEANEFKIESDNPVERIFSLKYRLSFPDGTQTRLMVVTYMYATTGSDVVNFDLRILNSDTRPEIPSELTVDSISVESGEYHTLDFSRKLGFRDARKVGQSWVSLCRGETEFTNGSRFEMQGAIYGSPSGISPSELFSSEGLAPRVAVLKARSVCDFYLSSPSWGGKWMVFGAVPQYPTAQGQSDAESFASFSAFLAETGDYFDSRPTGLTKYPGGTGDQEGFGATKGYKVICKNNPLAIRELLFSVAPRPYAHYNPDMSRVSKDRHQNWVTWSQRTHFLGLDRLGTDPLNASTPYGWNCADDQHFSFLGEQAAYALTGRLWLRDMAMERVEALLARRTDDAARALGRVLHTACNDFLLTGDARILPRLIADVTPLVNYAKAHTTGIFSWQQVSDARVLSDASGPVLACVIWWQGLMVPGLRALFLLTHDPGVGLALRKACETVVTKGFFQKASNGRWEVVDNFAWNNGEGVDPSTYGDGEVPGRVHTTGWFAQWCVAAPIILETMTSDPALLARCRSILSEIRVPYSWRDAEWQAII